MTPLDELQEVVVMINDLFRRETLKSFSDGGRGLSSLRLNRSSSCHDLIFLGGTSCFLTSLPLY